MFFSFHYPPPKKRDIIFNSLGIFRLHFIYNGLKIYIPYIFIRNISFQKGETLQVNSIYDKVNICQYLIAFLSFIFSKRIIEINYQ